MQRTLELVGLAMIAPVAIIFAMQGIKTRRRDVAAAVRSGRCIECGDPALDGIELCHACRINEMSAP